MLRFLAEVTDSPIPLPVQLGIAVPFITFAFLAVWWLASQLKDANAEIKRLNGLMFTDFIPVIKDSTTATVAVHDTLRILKEDRDHEREMRIRLEERLAWKEGKA